MQHFLLSTLLLPLARFGRRMGFFAVAIFGYLGRIDMAPWLMREKRETPTVSDSLSLLLKRTEELSEKVDEALTVAKRAETHAKENMQLLRDHEAALAPLLNNVSDISNMVIERRSVHVWWKLLIALGAGAVAVTGLWTLIEKARA